MELNNTLMSVIFDAFSQSLQLKFISIDIIYPAFLTMTVTVHNYESFSCKFKDMQLESKTKTQSEIAAI